VLAGAAIGAVTFAVGGSALRSFIFALPTMTGASIALVALAVAVLTLGAMAAPVRRALAVDPTVALREE
jgi:ABC-type antimicrobial peptide transport system permease subunit